MPEWKEEIRQRLAGLKLEPAREAEIVDELSQHLEDRYTESLAGGATQAEAEGRTLAELSDSELLAKELLRVESQAPQEPIVPGSNRRGNMLADLWQDLRYGVRMLAKQPRFTAVVVFTLALGIGVNTSIFTFFNLYLRPLPVKDPDSLVNLEYLTPRSSGEEYSYLDYLYFRDRAKTFSSLIARERKEFLLDNQSPEPQRVEAEFVSDNFFSTLGAGMILGRAFTPEENSVPGKHPVAVLSYYFWQKQFAGDPQVVGNTLRLRGQTLTIIGVTAKDVIGLRIFRAPDVWLPLMMRAELASEGDRGNNWFDQRSYKWLSLTGRLAPGRTLDEARAEAALLMKQLISAYPEIDARDHVRALPAATIAKASTDFWGVMGSALGATLLVLLIACSNVGNLLLARTAGRASEIGVRLCLGASRWRLIRQLLTESFLLAGLGGVAGLLLAWWSVGLLAAGAMRHLDDPGERVYLSLSPDARVLGFTLLLSFFSSMVFGLVPALRATGVNLVAVVKDEGAAFGQRLTRSWLRNGLVVAQVSFCVVLLVTAGLLLRGLIRGTSLDRGFETKNVLGVDLNFDVRGYDGERQERLTQGLIARLETLPGVQAVSGTGYVLHTQITVPGESASEPSRSLRAYYNIVTPKHFETIGVPLIRGRDFSAEEMRLKADVVVVSETTARNLWPNQEPLGQRLKWSAYWLDGRITDYFPQVIGVARDAQTVQPGAIPPIFYYRIPKSYDRLGKPALLVRTERALEEMKQLAQAEAQALDPNLKLGMDSLENYLTGTWEVRATRGASELAALLGLLALLLVAIGIYGVMAYAVTRRTREIGIRMALGASRRNVVGLVLGQGLRLVGMGVAIGIAGSMAVSRLLSALLFGLSPLDPIAYVSVSLFLLAVALLATYLPARRGASVDPMVALRCE